MDSDKGKTGPGRTFVGLDLTAGKRADTVAILQAEGQRVNYREARGDEELVAVIFGAEPRVVAIDCPLSLPLGLCCLEETCPCSPVLAESGRACERELARQGIGCFFTTKRSIIKSMTYRGVALALRLRSQGLRVIETYPYGAKVGLFGRPIPRKGSQAANVFLLQRLAAVGLESALLSPPPRDHDQVDALLCALVAWLFEQGLAESLGLEEEGLIYLPVGAQHAVPQQHAVHHERR